MADSKISALTNYTTPDGANDVIPIVDNANSQTKKITRNNYLGITGNPVGHTDTQTLSNKTLGNTNTITLKGTLFTLQDDSDTSKQARFIMSGITTATTRSYTLPNASGTLVDLNTAQTLTNKTLTSPIINTATIANPTLTVDSISEFTGSNGVSVAGLNIKSSKLNTNNSVVTANITNAAVTPDKLGTGATSATVATSETTTSTSYAFLATTTDQVTVTIGANGVALVSSYCHFSNSGLGNYSLIGVDVSGANTVAAADATAMGGNVNATSDLWLPGVVLLTGLAAGSTTFKLKYRVTAGTGTFSARRIAVVPL